MDIDGVFFIHYLGEGFRRYDEEKDLCEVVQRGLEFVKTQHKTFVEKGDHKLALRYAWLGQYYEACSPEWLRK